MASETETEVTPIRDDDKEDVKESFKTILMELQSDVKAFDVHQYDFEHYLKEEVYQHFQDFMSHDTFSDIYDNEIETLYREMNWVKRCYKNINDDFDHNQDNTLQVNYLKNIPQPAQKTPEWYAFRKMHLTGSNLWKVFHTAGSRRQLIYEKLAPSEDSPYKPSLNDCTPLNWGHKYEPLTNTFYEYYNDVVVEEFGCIPHKTIPFLAASPDGIVTSKKNNGRMVEIKNVVSRVITKIPKMEYYIQMQLQMEVCDLDECDFVETKFIEYENEESFRKDKYHLSKGFMMVLIKDNSSLIYEYAPLFQNKEAEHNAFVESVYEKYGITSPNVEHNGMRWYRNIYWKLVLYSCVYVPRHKKWFEMALPQIEDCWKEIESGLHEENAHLKYKGKTRTRSNSNADEAGSPKPTLPNAKLLEVMDLTNIWFIWLFIQKHI